ncbi:MAG: hypothetical protein DME05_14925, partial [Candidatus Rokuibacteriota bacterium]
MAMTTRLQRPRANAPWPFSLVRAASGKVEGRRVTMGAMTGESIGRFDTGAPYPLRLQDFFGHSTRRTAPMTKYAYFFGGGHAEGSSLMRNLLGGKGCELAEMTNLGIPVPPGFTITTQAWARYNRAGRRAP